MWRSQTWVFLTLARPVGEDAPAWLAALGATYLRCGASSTEPSPPQHIQGQSQQSERRAYSRLEVPPICADLIHTFLFSMELVKKIVSVRSFQTSLGHLGAEWNKKLPPLGLCSGIYSAEEGHRTPPTKQRPRRKAESTNLAHLRSKMFALALFTLLTCSKTISVLAIRQPLWGFSPNSTGLLIFHSVHLFPFIY